MGKLNPTDDALEILGGLESFTDNALGEDLPFSELHYHLVCEAESWWPGQRQRCEAAVDNAWATLKSYRNGKEPDDYTGSNRTRWSRFRPLLSKVLTDNGQFSLVAFDRRHAV